MQGLRNLVGNARAHAAVTLAGWLDVGKGISHTAYFDELPTPGVLWIINISMGFRKREGIFVILGIYEIIGEGFCATHRVLWSPLLLSPVSASVKLAYEVFQMTKTN
jgi:hypothetical protein